jgi:predicted transcriptional regulator
MRGRKIISIMLLCALLLTVFLFYQPKVTATVDYILIVGNQGMGTNVTADQVVDPGFSVWGYAASYNNTAGYLGDVNCTWIVNNVGNSTAYTFPSTGFGSQFYADMNPGEATWIADDGMGHSDTVVFTINPSSATTDYIQIRDNLGGGGIDLSDPANYPIYPLGHNTGFYGAAYNHSVGYIGNVLSSSTWISANNSIATVTSPGYYSNIQCSPTNEGSVIITLDDGLGHSNTTNVTVVAAGVDSVVVQNSGNESGGFILSREYEISESEVFWAVGYNDTYGCVGEVSVTWTSSNTSIGTVTTPGVSTTFNAVGLGVCTVTADYGGGITNTTGPLIVLKVDYILVRDSQYHYDSMEVGMDFIYNWGGATRRYWAAGYNDTYGFFKYMNVSWESSNTSVGTVSLSGTSTTFTAGSDGTCYVSANLSGIIDETGMITVSSYDVDYINIRDEPFGGGNVIENPSYSRSSTDIFYGAMYSDIVGYIADTPYNTNWNSTDTAVVTVTTPGNYSTITCDDINFGSTVISFWFSGNNYTSNSTTVTVLEWTIDYIRIDDAGLGMGAEVLSKTYGVYDTDVFYASAYNFTQGFITEVPASWSSDDDTVGTVTTPGSSTIFIAQWVTSDSTCQVTASWDVFSDSTGLLTVLAPTMDFVQIRNAPDGLGAVITSISYDKGETDIYYGAGYNDTVGFLDNVAGTSTWTSSDDTIVSVTSPGYFSDITCSVINSGTVTITLNDGLGNINTTSVTVLEWALDYVLIRDAPSGGGIDLTDPANYKTFSVGESTIFYGAMYNNTAGFIGDVSSITTWESSDPNIVDASSPGEFSTITCSNQNHGTEVITMEEWTGHTATTEVTVLEPTMDFINIMDAAEGAGDIVGDMEYNIAESDEFYAAAFNYTAGYIFDISVDWTSNNTDVGIVTTPGFQTNFSAEGAGACFVTADYGGGISDTTGTLTVTYPLTLTVDETGGAMFETISEALEYAQNGSTLFVYPGTYYENFTIDKSITLAGANKATTKIDGEEAQKVINVVSGNVTIKEFTIQNGVYNIYCDETDATDILYCIIKDYEYGIYDYKTTDAYIAYNTITEGKYGIVTFEAYNDAIRWNNISYNTEYGAKDYNSQLVNCFNWNYFFNNNIAYYYDPDVELSTMEFDGNIFEDNEIAIKVENASTISLTNNTMTRNVIGILLSKASPNIAGNIISVADYGIYSENSSPLISNNIIGEISNYAIYAKSGDSLRIVNNTVTDSEMLFIDSNINELWVSDTTVTQINTTVEESHLDETSNIEIKWKFQIRIVDKDGGPIEDAVVMIYDSLDNLVSAHITDSEGWIEITELFDTIQTGSATTNFNPYRIVVIKDSKEQVYPLDINEDTISEVSFEGKATKVQSSSPSIFWSLILLVGFIGAIGVGGLVIEVMKFGLLILFLPLYTRLRKDKLLDQPTRERIYGYIIGNPGAYFGLIKHELELGNGQLVYHLKQLEDAHLVYSREDGLKKRFYPSDVPNVKDGESHFSSIQEKILGVIKDNSGIGQKKLAKTVGISRQVAGYHLTKMERKGLIDKEVVGRESKYYASRNYSI